MFKFNLILFSLVVAGYNLTTQAKTNIGVYDPGHAFEQKLGLRYEQIWIDWSQDDVSNTLSQLQAIIAKGRTPILTIDPFAIRGVGSSGMLLRDVAAGKYDKVIQDYATAVTEAGSTVLVRWGPEMERNIDKPWSAKPAADYIAAYRHFATVFRAGAPESPMIWSPIGNDGCTRYYPGKDYVDYVGLSVYEYPFCTIKWYGHPRSFIEWMEKKYPPLAKFEKPVMIVELGIFDAPEKQSQWIKDAFNSLDQFPLVNTIIYYNSKDPVSWGNFMRDAVAPDWRIDPATLLITP